MNQTAGVNCFDWRNLGSLVLPLATVQKRMLFAHSSDRGEVFSLPTNNLVFNF